MRFVTLPNGSKDGRLHLVSRDSKLAVPAAAAQTLQSALDEWHRLAPQLETEYAALNEGAATSAITFDASKTLAPMPRAWQWLDGSAYDSHGALLAKVFGVDAKGGSDRPLMYQGVSDRFLSPTEDVFLPSEEDGIDFEGEFGVITDAVPMGTKVKGASGHIRLIVQINDWSLRRLAPIEMKTGFGWLQCKPHCSMAPVAITPDELGSAWRDHQVALPLRVELNGKRFGNANGYGMAEAFDQLIEHAAYSRDLVPGTIIGSGTVSNENFREVGSSCIAERRAIEILDEGEARTPFMSFGDRVRMEALDADGGQLFGAIDQEVCAVRIPDR
ncbi:MAG TPA: fumarylacetoacetate hydrolase family protein [Rhizobiaceae bacterium]|nr:fumarylacetoacetate hydrolase family protein [Rhizobiaceae bacterium]